MSNKNSLEKFFIILFAFALVYQIFIPPVVGLADNGDFARIIDKVGIYTTQDTQFMGNINLTYNISPKFMLKGYQSSELIFVYTSILLNSLLSKDGQFYVLILASVHIIAFLICLWLIAKGLNGIQPSRWIIYLCIFVFFSDVGYVAYLNSIYSEPASIIFLALTLGVIFMILKNAFQGEVDLAWLFAFFAASFLFVIAKPQNAAMGVFLAYLGLRFFTLLHVKKISLKRARLFGWILSAGLIVFSFLFFAFGLPKYYRSGDLWNSIFMEIVGRSENPAQALQELGLPAEMIQYKGTHAFSEGVNRNVYEDFQHSWLYFKVLKYYVIHPGQLFSLIDETTKMAFELQPENLGNFTISLGSYTKSKAFAVWNDLRVALLPKSIWTLIGLLLVNLGAIVVKIKKFDRAIPARLISETHLVILLMAVFQYLTVIMAEGTFELIKHMFLFNLLLDVTLVFMIAYLVSAFSLFKPWKYLKVQNLRPGRPAKPADLSQ